MKKPVKDVFGFWQIKNASFSVKYQFPHLEGSSVIPDDLVAFSKRKKETAPENKAIHFYEYDEHFVNVFNSEKKLKAELDTLRKYKCVISPDFSVYRDMPLCMQVFQVYKNRAAGSYLAHNGIRVVPNVRWGTEETYDFAFESLYEWGIVAVGSYKAYSNRENAYYFEKGFIKMLDVLDPETVLCYGKLSSDIKNECNLRHIGIREYPVKSIVKARLQ